MFQNFDTTADPSKGPARLASLRAAMATAGVDAFLVPRADAHQGEYVAPADERLAWLTGFTGSAGFAAILSDQAGVFVDGRYRTQVRLQCDMEHFTPVHWPESQLADWLSGTMTPGQTLALDPWLHTVREAAKLETTLRDAGVSLRETENLVDAIWPDQPRPPMAPASAWPPDLAGRTAADKRSTLAGELASAGLSACVITLPDSLCWLLNIRGGDLPRTPLMQGFAILHADGRVQVFTPPEKLAGLNDHLGPEVSLHAPEALGTALQSLSGTIGLDHGSCPLWVLRQLEKAGIATRDHSDPCALPKACKTAAEIAATRAAHLRDGAAVTGFLHWLDTTDKAPLTEIDVVRKLEGFRRETNALRDISFDTICGAGEHAAIMHYRVTHETNKPLAGENLLLVDSGGQYLDGTTDITRTIAIDTPSPEQKRSFTRVLQGMIAVSRARFPKGVAGAHLDALARAPLWAEGRDFDHGTGHGVGVYMSVHEGPQRLSRVSNLPLEPGMILSNEPGHYVVGDYGIRIENLVVVCPPGELQGGDEGRALMSFETITWAPIDRRLIDTTLLGPDERLWLDSYHAEVESKLAPLVDADTAAWLARACAPL